MSLYSFRETVAAAPKLQKTPPSAEFFSHHFSPNQTILYHLSPCYFFQKKFPLREDLVIFMLNFSLLRLNPNFRLSKFVKDLHKEAFTSPLKKKKLIKPVDSGLFQFETTTLEILMQKYIIFLRQPLINVVYRV